MRPPDDVKRELIQQWLTKAEQDFGAADYLLGENAPYLGVVGFHARP